jgi:chromosome segregation ATPase
MNFADQLNMASIHPTTPALTGKIAKLMALNDKLKELSSRNNVCEKCVCDKTCPKCDTHNNNDTDKLKILQSKYKSAKGIIKESEAMLDMLDSNTEMMKHNISSKGETIGLLELELKRLQESNETLKKVNEKQELKIRDKDQLLLQHRQHAKSLENTNSNLKMKVHLLQNKMNALQASEIEESTREQKANDLSNKNMSVKIANKEPPLVQLKNQLETFIGGVINDYTVKPK